MTWNDFILHDDYHPLLPPYKDCDQIELIEHLLKRRSELNIEIIFKKCEHEPIRLFQLDKVIKRFNESF